APSVARPGLRRARAPLRRSALARPEPCGERRPLRSRLAPPPAPPEPPHAHAHEPRAPPPEPAAGPRQARRALVSRLHLPSAAAGALLGFSELLRGSQQRPHLPRLPARELVRRPDRDARFRELLDLLGGVATPRFAQPSRKVVPRLRELFERESVELVELFLDIGNDT